MSDTDEPDDLVVLIRISGLAVARLLCGRLAAEGIETFLPDERRASEVWHWQGVVSGIRVQVRRADLARAQAILEEAVPEAAVRGESGDATVDDATVDDATISVGDRRAYRAQRVALLTTILPGVVHPYSLWLAVQALRRSDLTSWGRWRAWVALLVSLLGCAGLGLVAYWLARVH